MIAFPAGGVVALLVTLDAIVYLVVEVLLDDLLEIDDIFSALTILGALTEGFCSSVNGEGERNCALRTALFAASSPLLVFNSIIYRQRFMRSTLLCQRRSGHLR